jgi:hypothetical protein
MKYGNTHTNRVNREVTEEQLERRARSRRPLPPITLFPNKKVGTVKAERYFIVGAIDSRSRKPTTEADRAPRTTIALLDSISHGSWGFRRHGFSIDLLDKLVNGFRSKNLQNRHVGL